MSTSWKSQVAKDDYRIQFETDDYKKYLTVEKACCDAIDITNEKDAAIKKIKALVEKAQHKYLAATGKTEPDTAEAQYRQGVVRGLLDALYSVGGTSEKQQGD